MEPALLSDELKAALGTDPTPGGIRYIIATQVSPSHSAGALPLPVSWRGTGLPMIKWWYPCSWLSKHRAFPAHSQGDI